MQRVWRRREAYTGFWWGNMRDRGHLGDPDVDGKILLRWIFRIWDVGVWTGSSWLRIGVGGREGDNEPPRSIKCGEYLLAENRLALQEGPCSME
jgi:hypothetical protein